MTRPPAERGGKRLTAPEDLLLWCNPAKAPKAVAAVRVLEDEEGVFRIDPAIALDEEWHGAAVVTRKGGDLAGVLLVDGGIGTIVPIDEAFE